MVGQASEAGGCEAGFSGFADGGSSVFVFVVGGGVADPSLQASPSSSSPSVLRSSSPAPSRPLGGTWCTELGRSDG